MTALQSSLGASMTATTTPRTFAEETGLFDRAVNATNFMLDLWWLWAMVVVLWWVFIRLRDQHALLGQLDERCEAAFGDIDALLAERHAVIPNLIETVKGYVGHEHAVLTEVTQARAKALQSLGHTRMEAEHQLGQTLVNLFSFTEAYPNLEASQHFLELRRELTRIEEKVTASRKFYNLSVEELYGESRAFPGNLIARFTKLGEYEKFTLGDRREALAEPVRFSF